MNPGHAPESAADPVGESTLDLPVYVIHWNAPDWCVETVESILRSAPPVRPRVTVVDNGMRRGASPLRRTLPPGVRILETPTNLGYAGAANIALADWQRLYPQSEHCVLTSHDVLLEDNTLASLVQVASSQPGAGVVAPYVHNAYVGPVIGAAPDGQLPTVSRRAWVSGTCLLVTRACVNQTGAFDTHLHSYCEDADLCERARAAGFAVLYLNRGAARSHGTANGREFRIYYQSNLISYVARTEGVAAMLPSYARLLSSLPRHFVGSLRIWRPKERRAASYLAFTGNLGAARRVPRLIWRERRHLAWRTSNTGHA